MVRSLQTSAVVLLCVLLAVTAATAGVAPVAAQDGGDVPSLPAVYYGDLTVSGGTVDEPVKLDVVADGSVQDTILVDADGSIGGPTISDDKLEVQEPNETDIEFQIAGAPVTVASVDGEPVNAESITFASGTQEIVLEADPADVEPSVGLEITNVPESVEAGETVSVDIAAENIGGVAASQDVELLDFAGDTVDDTTVDLDIDATTTTSLTWDTTENDAGNGSVTVRAGDTTVTHALTVEQVAPPVVAQPAPGGATRGDDSETNLSDGVTGSDDQEVRSDDDFGISQVRFTNATAVESITWSTTDITGTVTATEYTTPPADIGAAPGAMISLSEISGSTVNDTDPSTIQFALQTSQLTEINASADELRIYHFVEGEWTALETTVVETDDDDVVVVQADPESLSYFAVSAVSEPTAEFTVTPTDLDTETPVVIDASSSTTSYGDLVTYDWVIDGTTASGETVETNFTDAGTVEIELTVENDAGETDTTTQSVSVAAISTDNGNGTSTDDDSGATEEGLPGFTALTALLALLVSVAAVRYRAKK
ncbi:PKD domain-containing protein [Halorubrum sp. N11]|uniref:PKD domain-containing protein n=1 Tax=Halorubrum sp. N11 TaxID=3402276 RepID=UPI003EBBCCBE